MPAPPPRPRSAAKPRLGNHVSIAGGVERAADRAHELGCEALQIFSASPRQWRGVEVAAANCRLFAQRRRAWGLRPLVIHDNYLINLAGANPALHAMSSEAFRGELRRAVALGADYLVMHPGSAGGGGHAEAIARLAESIRACARRLNWGKLRLLIENTAGGNARLGGAFAEVAAIIKALRGLPVGACIDTCHCFASGHDLRTAEGYEAMIAELDATIGLRRVRVIHANDSKGGLGSHLDRHQNIGQGQIGDEPFHRLLHDPRLAHAAFILETPIDHPGDDRRNLDRLKALRADAE
ncbi:MAG: deoxyribonuclease IV [Terriglobales bacterium]